MGIHDEVSGHAGKLPGAGFFADHDVSSLQSGLAAGAFTSVDLVRHAAQAISRWNPEINAFAHVDIEAALDLARTLDAERSQGRTRGPLHGIPIALKDNIDTADMPTTVGSAHYANHRPTADAECVTRLREAGAIIIGKTVTHEFAYGPTGDRSLQGAVRNPWSTTQMSGGSSAGSGAAVAAGMVPVALGSDTGGSVRIPAALCGVFGFKPTHGTIPETGVFPLAPTLEDVGVLARCARDAAIVFNVLGKRPASAPACIDGWRAGWVPNAAFAVNVPAVSAVVRAYAERMAGHPLPDIDAVAAHAAALQRTVAAIQKSEAYETHAERIVSAPEQYDAEVLERLRTSREVAGWEYVRALKDRAALQAAFAKLFETVDVLAMPTVAVTAPALGQRRLGVAEQGAAVRESLLGLTSPWNVLGLPAVSIPAGFVGGLPVGLQWVAAAGQDDALLAFVERASK